MRMFHCPNCGKDTGHKRCIGIGTLLPVIVTCGLWLLVIPFYPARCIISGKAKFL